MLNIKLLESPHPFAANTYLISSAGDYAIIDPTLPFDADLIDGKVRYILLTHAHFDHILEVDSWVNATGAEVICSIDEKDALSDPIRNCFKIYNGTDGGYFGESRGLSDGEKIPFGDGEIQIIFCPGHTVGCATYLFENYAFVGDTIFENGGYGRFDLPTSSLHMLRQSIDRLMSLPEDTVVYPGHGGSTTIKQYKLDYFR